MKLRFFFILHLFLINHFVSIAQNSISGSVRDKSNEPVVGANVFIANTSLGVITDQSGNFEITDLPPGYNKIVVNKLGFKSYTGSANRELKVQLNPDLLQKTVAKKDKKEARQWKKLYNQFEKAFLGISINAKQSKILNPEVIQLSKDNTGKISAYSIDLIQIENLGTGYMIHYLLDAAELQNGQITFTGKALFTELEAKDGAQIVKWKMNKERTFSGSRRHFLMALANDQLEEEGFEIYSAKFDNASNTINKEKRLSQSDVMTQNELTFKNFIGIVYLNEAAEPAYVNEHRTMTSMPDDGPNQVARGSHAIYEGPDNRLQASFLFNRASKVVISKNGTLKNPEYLANYGYWKWERAADLMPKTYPKK